MQVNNRSRVKGVSCLLALLVSALFTNCTCGPIGYTPPERKLDYSQGDKTKVAGCDGFNYDHYTGDPMTCQGSVSAADDAPKGWVLPITEDQMRKCPDTGDKISSKTPFTIYWTLTNITDAVLTDDDVTSYKLLVNKINDDGSETTVLEFSSVPQPKLSNCEWQDVGFIFNSTTPPVRTLAPGKYSFNLTGIYDFKTGYLATAPIKVTITE